ncbi:Cap-specific mRNA (nucleoside-2'-O-)-methyltransferase 1 [Myotis davidii]|uniref:Cap-specific mRNA (nucleoside-2'-O-)-methyltransferase 1 n=1 Tax=Myotis davidii TaxID=225400 RepID=L5MG48_MYODS|nr:Cap-specific mRNA (nucleoside-2'-O-)-methyltransferase 1 [Myotis davidii]
MIQGVFFLNRAAMKMANMDFVFDRIFTNPWDSCGKPLVKDREAELLYFADICAGPGGFSEYVLWRKKWHAKGFGMTLKGPNDFKLEDFYSASSELFEPYYGEGGIDGDNPPREHHCFLDFVLDNTNGKGVHFLRADGSFSMDGRENLGEILSKQLLLCQFSHDRWVKLDLKTELPQDTLLSVEIVHELKGEGKAQRKMSDIHILDVLVLNGSNVWEQHFNRRIQLAEKFVKAVSKPSWSDTNPIRVKEVYRLEEMEKIFVRLEMKIIKGSSSIPKLSYTGRDNQHFVPTGLYMIRTVNEPSMMGFSEALRGSSSTIRKEWGDGIRVHDSQKPQDPDRLSKEDVLSFIQTHRT